MLSKSLADFGKLAFSCPIRFPSKRAFARSPSGYATALFCHGRLRSSHSQKRGIHVSWKTGRGNWKSNIDVKSLIEFSFFQREFPISIVSIKPLFFCFLFFSVVFLSNPHVASPVSLSGLFEKYFSLTHVYSTNPRCNISIGINILFNCTDLRLLIFIPRSE